MKQPFASARTDGHDDQASIIGVPLTGRWLLLARLVWCATFFLSLAFLVMSIVSNKLDVVITLFLVATTSVWFVVSGVLFWRKSHDRLILLFSLAFLVMGGIFFPPFPAALFTGIPWPWEVLMDVIESLAQAACLVFFLFPDGRFVPRFTRWLALAWVVLSFDLNIPSFINVGALNPWSSASSLLIYRLIEIAFLCAFAFSQLYRYRRASTSVQRQQTKWTIFSLTIACVGGSIVILVLSVFPAYFPTLALPAPLAQVLDSTYSWVLAAFLPISIGIALLRYRLWDIDIVINRTLVYGTLTLSIVTLYVLVVIGLGTFLQVQGNLILSLVATGFVAVLFQPLRDMLQRGVNRLLYGERDEPYQVLTRLGSRLEGALAPEVVLPTIVETVGQALKLPYVAITLREGDASTPEAFCGTRREGERLLCLPLLAQQEHVGELILASRTPGESFTPTDLRLLEDLSRQIGVAVYAVRLTEQLKRLTGDLQQSRERLVTAREEERRRLRRDLHDGLGPQLASLTLKLDTARNRLSYDPLADTLLSGLAERTQETVADIRRLVYDLRPPALDELGLVSALRALTLQYSEQVTVFLDAPDQLPELPAAVEVAIYRIAQEALTNVVRHAEARHCRVQLALDESTGWLSLTIQDDGHGLPLSRPMGVGMNSMRERAEELGGTCTLQAVPMGGTRVLALLPSTSATNTDRRMGATSRVAPEEV